jgi:DNA-(apurinic or apyrimidinic site) lyase
VRQNEERISIVAEKLSSLGLESALKIEEVDPQFQAIRLITSKMNFGPALTLIVLNSIISYRLSGRGEDYWNEFALYVSRADEPKSLVEAVKLMLGFLSTSKINVALRAPKTSRLLRASTASVLEPDRIVNQARNLRRFAEALALSLKSRWSSKTIVFSLKMICYAYRARYGRAFVAPFNIPIPVDSRVAKLSWTSGVVDVEGASPKRWGDVVEAVMSGPRVAQRAWSAVAKKSGIPPLHLDSILWLVGGFVDRRRTREEAVKEACEALSRTTAKSEPDVFDVASELIFRYL